MFPPLMFTVPILPTAFIEPPPPIAALAMPHLFAKLYAYILPPDMMTSPGPPFALWPIPPPIAVPAVVDTAVTLPPEIVT